jgi:hypothetical protein
MELVPATRAYKAKRKEGIILYRKLGKIVEAVTFLFGTVTDQT